MILSPTVDEWAKMTQAQKSLFNRKINFGSVIVGASIGAVISGPVGAVIGSIGSLLFGSWYAHKNLPGGLL